MNQTFRHRSALVRTAERQLEPSGNRGDTWVFVGCVIAAFFLIGLI